MEPGEPAVRGVFELWNSGVRDPDDDRIDPDFEVHSALTTRVYRGPDQVRGWIAEIDDQFDDWNLSIDSVRSIEPDRLLVNGGIHGRGRQSGIDLDEPAAWIITLREGRLLIIRNFIGRDQVAQAESEA